jgi:hypothetical protein
MIVLMIFRVGLVAQRIRSMIKIMSRSYRISAPPKYGCNFSGTAIEPSAC